MMSINTRCMTGLYLYGDRLNPVTISRILRVEGDFSSVLGQQRPSVTGRTYHSKSGVWCLEAKNSDSVEAGLIEILSRIDTSAFSTFSELPGVDDTVFDCFVSIVPDAFVSHSFGLGLGRELLTKIGKLECRIAVKLDIVPASGAADLLQ
jgi:hypothetical protein